MELPTYTNIWRIEKRLYKLYDFRLPMPLPVGQIAVFTAIAVPYVIILTLLGLPFSHTSFWLYVLPPGVLAWLATRPVLESKRLPELIVSQLRYLGEPRSWCRLAPLAEKEEILVVARVWRRAEEPPPELAAQRQLKPARRGALASPEPAVATASLATAVAGLGLAGRSRFRTADRERRSGHSGLGHGGHPAVPRRGAGPAGGGPDPRAGRPGGPQPGGHAVPRGAASPGAPALHRPARGTAAGGPDCGGLGPPGCACVGPAPPRDPGRACCRPGPPRAPGSACSGLGPASGPGRDGWPGAACAVARRARVRRAAARYPRAQHPRACYLRAAGRRSSVRDGDRGPAGRPSAPGRRARAARAR